MKQKIHKIMYEASDRFLDMHNQRCDHVRRTGRPRDRTEYMDYLFRIRFMREILEWSDSKIERQTGSNFI